MELVIVAAVTSGTEKKPGQAGHDDFLSTLLGGGWWSAVLIFADIFYTPVPPTSCPVYFLLLAFARMKTLARKVLSPL